MTPFTALKNFSPFLFISFIYFFTFPISPSLHFAIPIYNSHPFTSFAFTFYFLSPSLPPLFCTFLTLVLKIWVLPWEFPIAHSGSWFQSVIDLFTKEYFPMSVLMVEWAIETCRREMLINQSVVFGCCVCVDWTAADQLAQRGDIGQTICKFRKSFRIASDAFWQNTCRLCSNSTRGSQCHSVLLYTLKWFLYNIQCLSWAVDSVRQNTHCPKETSRFPIKSTKNSQCGCCSPLHILSPCL